MKRYEAVRGLRTTCYRLVPSYSGVQDFFIRFPTASYCDVARYGLAKHSCVIKYSTYQYIPVCTCTYWYVPEHTGSYQNIHSHTSTTSTYQYIPVNPISDQGCTWHLMTDRRRRSRQLRPAAGHHGLEAHACMATALDMFNVPVDSGATQKQPAT